MLEEILDERDAGRRVYTIHDGEEDADDHYLFKRLCEVRAALHGVPEEGTAEEEVSSIEFVDLVAQDDCADAADDRVDRARSQCELRVVEAQVHREVGEGVVASVDVDEEVLLPLGHNMHQQEYQ